MTSKDEITKDQADEEKARADAMLSEEYKKVKEAALRASKKLEREDVMSDEELAKDMKKFANESEKAKSLLTPWFVKKKKKQKK